MSKNITIAEGTQAKNFSNVSKVRINNIGGGTSDWIPEEDAGLYANLGEASITKNGTYNASDEDYDGFSKVTVKVDPKVTTKTITKNGIYKASKDKADGFSEVSVQVPNGSGGNLITKSISENGTYDAQDDDADGYSSVTVNVGGGGGGTLITKEITANGTYNASADGADGYSSVIVNVAAPQHGNSIVDGLSGAVVGQRISTKDFFYDFDEKFFFAIDPTLISYNYPFWRNYVEDGLRGHKWEYTELIPAYPRMMDYTNLVIFASGWQDDRNSRLGFYLFGIADDNATVSVSNITANGFDITISNDTKFFSAQTTYYNPWSWTWPNGAGGGGSQANSALDNIDNNVIWGNSGTQNTIHLPLPIPTLSGGLGTGLMTNLIGGTPS